MSRSYRKPIFKDGYGKKWKKKAKRFANRKIRNIDITDEVADGGSFKKEYESWDICDFRFDERFGAYELEYHNGTFHARPLTAKEKAIRRRK